MEPNDEIRYESVDLTTTPRHISDDESKNIQVFKLHTDNKQNRSSLLSCVFKLRRNKNKFAQALSFS